MSSPGVLGGDPPAMRTLAGRLEAVSAQLSAVRTNVGAEIDAVEWLGADATRFRKEWLGTYVPALKQLIDDLNGAAVNIRGDADLQDRTSRAW